MITGASVGSSRKYLLQLHLAVFLFGMPGLFAKIIDLPAVMVVWGRVFFAALLLGGIHFLAKKSIRLNHGRDYGLLIIMGAILALHWFTFFQSVRVSSIAVGLLTFSTYPIFTVFLEPLVFKERLRRADVFLALVTLVGIAFIIPRFQLGDQMFQGALWGIAAGLSFAVLSILNRQVVQSYSGLLIAFYQMLVATLVLTPLIWPQLPWVSWPNWLLLALLGAIFTAVAHALFITSLSAIKAKTASIVACLESVYAIVAAVIFLGEIPSKRVLVGGAIVMLAAGYASMRAADTSPD